jgi:short-subunit dehydrogenase
MDVNFFGVIRLTNLILSYMIEDTTKRDYSIVNVGSVQSYLGNILNT